MAGVTVVGVAGVAGGAGGDTLLPRPGTPATPATGLLGGAGLYDPPGRKVPGGGFGGLGLRETKHVWTLSRPRRRHRRHQIKVIHGQRHRYTYISGYSTTDLTPGPSPTTDPAGTSPVTMLFFLPSLFTTMLLSLT